MILIEGVLKIIDLLTKGVERGEARKKERFEKSFKPLLDDFLLIHANYSFMFMQVRDVMVDAVVSEAGQTARVAEAKKALTAQRVEYDGLRTKLRALAPAIVAKTADADERRFLWSIIVYFLQHEQPSKPYRDLDSQAARLVAEGKDAVLSTPSSYLLGVIEKGEDPDKILRTIDTILNELNGYLSDVTRSYALLHMRAYEDAG
jgi:predicted lipid carrier protein YhbT